MGNSPAWDSGCGWSGNRTARTLSSPLSSERERTLTPPGNKERGLDAGSVPTNRLRWTEPFSILRPARLARAGAAPYPAAPAGAQTAAPEITSGATFSVKENATAVATLTATDTDAAQLRWSIPAGMAGGADGAVFSLSDDAGVLTFSTAPDYETPTDDDGDNVYEVTVQVSDGSNTDTAALEVTVTNVAEGVPNIVIILADDLGYGDVAHLNSQSQIPTPNLDALAQAGMAFLDAHTPSSVCTRRATACSLAVMRGGHDSRGESVAPC